MGDLWAGQQLGVDSEPKVVIEYGIGGDIEMRVGDPLPLRKAIDGVLEVFFDLLGVRDDWMRCKTQSHRLARNP
jgi:hypothetical protein